MKALVYSTKRYQYLASEFCARQEFEPGSVERRFFGDGERYQRIDSPCEGRDVILVGGTVSDEDTMELYDLACGLASYGARSLSLVVPFFGYSTMERAVLSGEVVTAKNRARLLSSIPQASNGNRILLMDLHVDGITHYFEGSMRPVHVYAKSVIKQAAVELGGKSFVLGCTDAGRAKWVESLAHDLGVDAAFVYKRREGDGDVKVTGVSAHVSGKVVVIYDDMIRSGASLLNAAQAYRNAGATGVSALTTHALFPGDAVKRIQQTSLVDHIVATNTHPRANEIAGSLVEVRSIEPVLASALGADC